MAVILLAEAIVLIEASVGAVKTPGGGFVLTSPDSYQRFASFSSPPAAGREEPVLLEDETN